MTDHEKQGAHAKEAGHGTGAAAHTVGTRGGTAGAQAVESTPPAGSGTASPLQPGGTQPGGGPGAGHGSVGTGGGSTAGRATGNPKKGG